MASVLWAMWKARRNSDFSLISNFYYDRREQCSHTVKMGNILMYLVLFKLIPKRKLAIPYLQCVLSSRQ